MRNYFLKGITAGAILGAAAGMMLMPQLDRSTKRKIRRSGAFMKNVAEDMVDNMRSAMK